jgi:hypothetical protein
MAGGSFGGGTFGGPVAAPECANLGDLRSDLNSLAGLDLAPDTADRLLNEGTRALVCRAEWLRAGLELGPTAADQEAYSLSGAIHRVRKLKVDGTPYLASSEEQVDELKQNWKSLRCAGVYWISFDGDAAESVSLYPLPTQAGLSIKALCSVYPAILVNDDDEPQVPCEYRRAIVDYAAALAYGYQEDNPELRGFHEDEFNNAVAGLRRLRTAKQAAGPVQVRVAGMT